tara:strand:+ start:51 stop:275 length:225 start_codon:yes stop_codon:yes gene_type:complete
MPDEAHPSTSFGPYQFRSNAMSQTPNFNQRPSEQRSNAIPEPPRPILTRGQLRFAEMPFIERLATKEIQYGHTI